MSAQGKIHPLPRNKVIRILEHNGFVRQKTRGPHYKFKKYDDNNRCIAWVYLSHAHESQPSHIRNVLRNSGKPESDFY